MNTFNAAALTVSNAPQQQQQSQSASPATAGTPVAVVINGKITGGQAPVEPSYVRGTLDTYKGTATQQRQPIEDPLSSGSGGGAIEMSQLESMLRSLSLVIATASTTTEDYLLRKEVLLLRGSGGKNLPSACDAATINKEHRRMQDDRRQYMIAALVGIVLIMWVLIVCHTMNVI